MASYSFNLHPLPPFRLDLTVWILRRRPENQVDLWDGRTYQRILVLDGETVVVSVTQAGSPDSPLLKIMLNGAGVNAGIEPRVASALVRLLGIEIDLRGFYQLSERNTDLKNLAAQFRGAKPPRFLTFFEAMVNAIACQQLSLIVGIQLLNRLSQSYGPAFRMEKETLHAFPRPEDLANADIEELRKLGFSYRKGEYLLSLAQSIVYKRINLDEIETLEDQPAIEQLCQIRGVGRWTAEYFLLRGLGRMHIFPGDDVGARNNLQSWLNLPGNLDYSAVQQALSQWVDYRGLIYFHLLLRSLAERGTIIA